LNLVQNCYFLNKYLFQKSCSSIQCWWKTNNFLTYFIFHFRCLAVSPKVFGHCPSPENLSRFWQSRMERIPPATWKNLRKLVDPSCNVSRVSWSVEMKMTTNCVVWI
jgi:hypothetical protein